MADCHHGKAYHAKPHYWLAGEIRWLSKGTPAEARRARFVRPELVAEGEFRSWTNDGLIRHSSFLGLREDKPAEEVERESRERHHMLRLGVRYRLM